MMMARSAQEKVVQSQINEANAGRKVNNARRFSSANKRNVNNNNNNNPFPTHTHTHTLNHRGKTVSQ